MARTLVALDLGSSGLRAVEFSRTRAGVTVRRVAAAPLPRGAIVAGEVQDSDALSAALRQLWAEHRLTRDVLFAVANHNVLVRQMDLPWLPPGEFHRALRHQVADHISVPVEQTILDYHVLAEHESPGEDGPQRMNRILLVVATAEMVDGFTAALHGAGLRPVQAELAPFALIRAARGPGEAGDTEALLEIGAEVTTVVIQQGGQPRFVRILPGQGGHQATDALAERLGWAPRDAEQAKISLGLATRVAAPALVNDSVFGVLPAPPPPDLPEQPAHQVLDEVVSGFIAEVRASVDFFLSATPDLTLHRVVLSGGGAQLGGLAARLSAELRLPVNHATPLAAVRRSRRARLPDWLSELQLSTAVGLALGAHR